MIIEEQINDHLVRHYSDQGVYIRQVETGIEYPDPVDTIPCRYTYEETDIPLPVIPEGDVPPDDPVIPPEEEPEVDPEAATIEDYEAALAELGVT